MANVKTVRPGEIEEAHVLPWLQDVFVPRVHPTESSAEKLRW